jgi:hypothetical protein
MKEETHNQKDEQSYFGPSYSEGHEKYGDSTEEFVIAKSQVMFPVVNCSKSVRGLYTQFLSASGQQFDSYLMITEAESIQKRKDL